MMKRVMVFVYGAVAYAMFLGVFLYAVGFIGNFGTPTTLDGEPTTPLMPALVINLLLLTLFALQHSGMARRPFKQWLTRFIPKEAERSTYVLMTNLALIALFAFWQPMGGTVWNIQGTVGQAVMYAGFAIGWLVVLYATFLINHFDLFGLRQVWLCLRGKEYTRLKFQTPGPYKHIRHPLYVGWFMVFWFTPTMTMAHLVFAVMTTAYILVAIVLEERDLIHEHGERYAAYRRRTGKFLPRMARKPAATTETETGIA